MAVDELPNGFTGFARRQAGFESAGEAMRRNRSAAAAGGAPAPAGTFRFAGTLEDRERSAQEAQEAAEAAAAGEDAAPEAAAAGEDAAPETAFTPEELAALQDLPATERRWAWVEIDLAAIRHNTLEAKRRLSGGCRLMAVVKADAYGHGAVPCARASLSAGASYLGVATVDEALELRRAGIDAPILVLAQPPASAIPLLLAYHVMPAVYDPRFAVAYGEQADLHGMVAPYHLAVNTGMNRIGVRYDDVMEFVRQTSFHRGLELAGTFTHFATADCPETLDFERQARRFQNAVADLRMAGVNPGIVHAANSAAILRYPNVHFDMARLGISLYGFHPCRETYGTADLRPAMSVHARITDTRILGVSEGVSYGLHYRSPGSVKVCTIPLGYADGLRRGLSGNTDVIYDGRYYRQVGNICMDQCMFEVDMRSRAGVRRADPQVGDEVLVVGTQGAAQVTIDEMAEKLGTIQHEIAIGFSHRMERIYA